MSSARLKEWVTRLGKEEMPSFANTARRMAALSNDKESSANDLAKVILQDTAMTTRVLRLANSVHYNPTGRKLDTVSYAIVILGFEQVRNLAITVSMLESTLTNNMLSHVKKEMACAYHAAIQAQKMAEKLGLKETENIYIAALLHRLGELMFWCFPFEHEAMLQAVEDDPDAYTRIENEVLGFSLKALTESLIQEWDLSPLLHDTLTNKHHRDNKNACIQLAFNLADCVKDSWDSPSAQRQIRAVSGLVNQPVKDTREWLIQNAKIAREGLHEVGLKDDFIAQPKSDDDGAPKTNVVGIFNKEPIVQETRADKQRRLLRQLTHLLNEEIDLNHFLTSMLECINAGCECDQSFLLLFKGKDQAMVLKQHLGQL